MKNLQKRIIIIGLIIIFIIAITVAIYPFLPFINYYLFPKSEEFNNVGPTSIVRDEEEIVLLSQGNLLIIPKIGVKIPIVEGEDEKSSLDKGAWRLPETSTPDKGSNTVLSGHRWKYRPPSEKTFYLLDKLEIGDSFRVYWEGKKYEYKVTSIAVVLPTDVDILNPTQTPVVTLITCTPLFSTAKRLVVKGDLME